MTAPQDRPAFPATLAPASPPRVALSRVLVAQRPDWDEAARLVMRDAALLGAVLAAAPLPRRRVAASLRTDLVERLELLGAGVLRAWLLQFAPGAAVGGANFVLAAECALLVARRMRYSHPDEAYLAGLWHDPAALACGAPEPDHGLVAAPAVERLNTAKSQRAFAAQLADRCGLVGPLVDALTFQPVLDEELADAHALVRILAAAKLLAHDGWERRLDRAAAIVGLERDELSRLRTDVDVLVVGAARDDAALVPVAEQGSSQRAADLERALREAHDIAASSLIGGAFAGIDAARAEARLGAACRLLCQQEPPLVVTANDEQRLAALMRGSDAASWYDELGQRLDDESSVIARAARSGAATLWFDAGAGRSLHDRSVSRWLGGNGIECLPLGLEGGAALAVVPADERRPLPPLARRRLVELATAAARRVRDLQAQQAAQNAMIAAVETRYREHARKIAHEARNPLTVISSYLSIMAQRDRVTPALAANLDVLHSELARIGDLLQRAAAPPAAEAEPEHCRIPELLHDLRALYGEALFESRGIRFELRATADLPPVALPGSALRQILLNLFRNASEALQPGGRFAVTAPGQVLSNGVPCAEIRLIDNGPGLAPERLADLFSPRPSAKGGEHEGLGLAIVREIVQRWHGSVLCRSQSGTGTSFQLLLPLAMRQRGDA